MEKKKETSIGKIPWNKGKTGVKGGVKRGNIPWNKGKKNER